MPWGSINRYYRTISQNYCGKSIEALNLYKWDFESFIAKADKGHSQSDANISGFSYKKK